MQHLQMKSFGPIKNLDMYVNDIILLNGLQSSGKSTIAKTIYYFRSIPETVFKMLLEEENITDKFEKKFWVYCRSQLMSIFGTTKHFDDFELKFDYAPEKFINIYKDYNTGHARIMPSRTLINELRSPAKKLEKYREEEKKESRDISVYWADRFQFYSNLKKEIKEIFEDTRLPFFVPAGRSLVSTLSGELKDIDSYNFDNLMQDFVQRIFYLRDTFSKDLEEIVEDKKRLTTANIDFNRIKLAKQLIENILNGKYRYQNGEERIYVDNENYVKIKFASSGQQESLWILLIIFIEILGNEESFGVIEEPEAHLYPVTQYEIVKLISLFASQLNNQAIITTHSPYIMAAFNNMLLAYNAGQKDAKNVKKIIPSLLWLDKNRISSYFVANGNITNIFDDESGIIDTTYVDKVSEDINVDFENLIDFGY